MWSRTFTVLPFNGKGENLSTSVLRFRISSRYDLREYRQIDRHRNGQAPGSRPNLAHLCNNSS